MNLRIESRAGWGHRGKCPPCAPVATLMLGMIQTKLMGKLCRHTDCWDPTVSTVVYLKILKRCKQLNSYMIQLSWTSHLRATWSHLPYGITQYYLPPNTSECTPPNPSQLGRYSIYLSRRDRRLSWPRWLGTYRDDLPVTRQSPIQEVTMPGVQQL